MEIKALNHLLPPYVLVLAPSREEAILLARFLRILEREKLPGELDTNDAVNISIMLQMIERELRMGILNSKN